MSIPYTYKIINVSAADRCMEVVYTAEGHGTMHVGARLPFQGESLESVIQMYAPVRYWEEQAAELDIPQVGTEGVITPPAPTEQEAQEMIVAAFRDAIQRRLDDFAKTRNYDGILSACTYATSTNPKFAAEGQYCVSLRDATWAAAYDILNEVTAGLRPQPTTIAEIEHLLPVMAWPENA